MNIVEAFEREMIVAVIRSDELSEAKRQFEVLVEAGVKIVEISFKNESSLEFIEWALAQEQNIYLGAASILNVEQAKKAAGKGVNFLVSPVCTDQILEFAQDYELTLIPGASTPSEIAKIIDKLNPPIIKLFPVASLLSFQGLKKVFPKVKFMLSGFSIEEMPNFLKAGADYFAIGAYFTDDLTETKLRFDFTKSIVTQVTRL